MESLECTLFHFFGDLSRQRKTCYLSQRTRFLIFGWVKCNASYCLKAFISVSLLLYIFLWATGWGFQNLPLLVLTVVCGVRKTEPVVHLEMFHLCRKGRTESDVDLCCCKLFWLSLWSSCTPAAQLCWARGFITHYPAYHVHWFVSAWAAIIWHFIWKAFTVLSWQHSVIHIFFTAGIIWKSSTFGSFCSSI